jgi:uncharacterized protein YlxW (UPF0749 family)
MDSTMAQLLGTIITAVAGIAGAYLAVQKGNRERDIKDAQREQKQSDRLDSIEEKMVRMENKIDEHNEYGRKFGEVATAMAVMAKDIEYLKSR